MTFENPTSTPTHCGSHDPEASQTDTSDALSIDTLTTPPIYATVHKKTSKKRSEKKQSMSVLLMVERGEGGGGGGGGELVYQVVESPGVATYEVPVPTATSPSSATNTVTQDEEYSTQK